MESQSLDKSVTRELTKRRVFAFVAVFTAIALPEVAILEGDEILHALDDYALVAISIAVIILLALWWKKQSLPQLKQQHNIIVLLFVIGFLFKIFAVSQEINDPTDFGDEIPLLILVLLTVINRFV